jgi:hypothetical protein
VGRLDGRVRITAKTALRTGLYDQGGKSLGGREEVSHAPLVGHPDSKDPSVVVEAVEDAAALIGLLVALVRVRLAYVLDNPVLDGVPPLPSGAFSSRRLSWRGRPSV